jgi:transcription antitermination factor NusG
MNWYVLYCQSLKAERLCQTFNKKQDIYAFIPQYEYYRRDIKGYVIKPMFPGYIFVQTKRNQIEFDSVILHMYEEKDGLIKQLRYDGTTALSHEEIHMFHQLLDDEGILRMSQAFIKEKKAVVYKGPLMNFEENIIKVDKHNQFAYLDLKFLNRNIKAGLCVDMQNNEV